MDLGGAAVTQSIWTYPWDLHDIGRDVALARVAAAGLTSISLATSYHAGRFLQPGNPRRRVYFPEDGTVYYHLDPALWSDAEIAPKQAAIVTTEGDQLDFLVRAREKGGPAVSAWTVCLHNTRLGWRHPGHVMRNCFGDSLRYALCPSSPAARAYVVGMVREITTRYRPDRVELESPNFMGFDHGYHHEKDGLGLLPEDRFLLGLCFCHHCTARAREVCIDIDAARRVVADHLAGAFARALPEARFPDFPDRGRAAFDDHAALAAFLDWRSEPVTSLIAEIRDAAEPASQILLIDVDDAWMGGVEIAKAVRGCDGIVSCAYSLAPEDLAAHVARMRALIGPERRLVAGLQMFHPEIRDATDLARRVVAASGASDGINYYNLGLIPASRLEWIRAAIDART